MKIGLLITTFIRDNSLYECLESISQNWNDNYYVIVIDQGNFTDEKDKHLEEYFEKQSGEYINLDFDTGALKARNIAIKRFKELNIPYILMMADSVQFKSKYDFSKMISFLEQEENRFLCGFDLKNRLTWECDLAKTDRFELDAPKRIPVEYQELSFQQVDVCRNFFLAKTEMFINALYDEDRKLSDHESSFWRFKEKGYKCFYCDAIVADYKKDYTEEYTKYRQRFYRIYLKQMMVKYNLTSWVTYSQDLKDKWAEEKKIANQ